MTLFPLPGHEWVVPGIRWLPNALRKIRRHSCLERRLFRCLRIQVPEPSCLCISRCLASIFKLMCIIRHPTLLPKRNSIWTWFLLLTLKFFDILQTHMALCWLYGGLRWYLVSMWLHQKGSKRKHGYPLRLRLYHSSSVELVSYLTHL